MIFPFARIPTLLPAAHVPEVAFALPRFVNGR